MSGRNKTKWKLEVLQPQVKRIHADSYEIVALEGKGFLNAISGRASVDGFMARPKIGLSQPLFFNCPQFSTWITLRMQPGCVVEVHGHNVRIHDAFLDSAHPRLVPRSWRDSIDEICRAWYSFVERRPLENYMTLPRPAQFCITVCGGKGVGKSAFSRLCVNSLLNLSSKVLFLDATLLLPELSPPGVVSAFEIEAPLLCSPHANLWHDLLSSCIHSEYYGSITARDDPDLYLSAVQRAHAHMVAYARQKNEAMPIVVCLDSWIKGYGGEVIQSLVSDVLNAGHVVKIEGLSPSTQLNVHVDETRCNLHTCRSLDSDTDVDGIPTNLSGQVSVQHLTELTWLAYFCDKRDNMVISVFDQYPAATGVDPGSLTLLASSLTSQRPYVVPFEAISIDFNDETRRNLANEVVFIEVLNGAIVALKKPSSMDKTLMTTIGFGIIRSIDYLRRCYFVLTPVDPKQLQSVCAFQIGKIVLPKSVEFLGPLSEQHTYMSHDVLPDIIHGDKPIKSRNNIKRRPV